MERDFKRSIHNTGKLTEDEQIQKISQFVNKVLVHHAYSDVQDPYLRTKYTAFLR